jgi:hypothetical protein
MSDIIVSKPSYANRDEDYDDSKPIYIYEAKGKQLTVAELLRALINLVRENPDAKNATVSHVEFGGITESRTVDIDRKGNVVISAGY